MILKFHKFEENIEKSIEYPGSSLFIITRGKKILFSLKQQEPGTKSTTDIKILAEMGIKQVCSIMDVLENKIPYCQISSIFNDGKSQMDVQMMYDSTFRWLSIRISFLPAHLINNATQHDWLHGEIGLDHNESRLLYLFIKQFIIESFNPQTRGGSGFGIR